MRRVVERRVLSPTARPVEFQPLEMPGFYVWRSADVLAKDVDEFVQLSTEAWEALENDEEFRSGPGGLFLSPPRNETVSMTFLTWYSDLTSWERSRTPSPEAMASFMRRRCR